jgi:transposase
MVIASYYYAPDVCEGSSGMRGPDEQTTDMFSYLSPEERVRPDHPLRAIRRMTDEVLRSLSPRFTKMYSDMGRPSIPPEQLLRALLLQGLYTIRSERLLIEEIDYSILFRWFIGLSLDEPIWSPTTFSKNRDRLLKADVASAFFDAVVQQAREAGLMSDEHFTVDGTVLEAWAGLKSFQRKESGRTPPPEDPGNPTVNFHGETRTNDTHQSTTDPDARLYRKGLGKEAKLAYLGHVLLDNRHGLVANVCTTAATGTGEWEAALLMLEQTSHATTVGGDKHFDVGRFVTPVRQLGITPHVAQKDTGSRIDERTTRHPGYAVSQRKRKLIEQVFGWMKTIGGLRKLRHRGGELVDWIVTFTAAAYNLVRLRTLLVRSA